MTKEKFDRGKPRLNIGEIGPKDISHRDYVRALLTFEKIEEESNKIEQAKLAKLIEQYGQEAGYDIYHKLKSQELEMFSECTLETDKGNSSKKR